MTRIGLEKTKPAPEIGHPKPNRKTDEEGNAIVIGPLRKTDDGARQGGLT